MKVNFYVVKHKLKKPLEQQKYISKNIIVLIINQTQRSLLCQIITTHFYRAF